MVTPLHQPRALPAPRPTKGNGRPWKRWLLLSLSPLVATGLPALLAACRRAGAGGGCRGPPCEAFVQHTGAPGLGGLRATVRGSPFLARRVGGAEGPGELRGIPESELDEESIEFARECLIRQWEGNECVGALPGHSLGGRLREKEASPYWAMPEWEFDKSGIPKAGSVVLAHPDLLRRPRIASALPGLTDPVASNRTGLPLASPAADRKERARLPVVLLTKRSSEGTEGLLLGAWSGSLLGDLDLAIQAFVTRPLYIGGPRLDSMSASLAILHSYPEMPGSEPLTPDGLMLSHDWDKAVSWVEDGPGSSLRFKFFSRRVFWSTEEEAELSPDAGIWMPARVSRDLLLREPDSAFEEPIWAQIVEHAGGRMREAASKYDLLSED
mmetsp:Transcript_122871/g.393603  ORF Transcript_122871/g.393603 Transcript_122871/m.393603 type:complete len:384 (-) Transcript_122871:495-1646(-)